MPGQVVALTGASGFIGSAILQRLVADGHQIRALTRRRCASTDKVRWVHGDLSNIAALGELVKDATAVIHCAGAVRGGSLEDFVATNANGTQNLIRVVIEQNIYPRFLLVSSLAAREPKLSWYAQSKQMAEQFLIASADRVKWAVFRPTAVYGCGDKELKPLFSATRRGILPVVGELSNRFSLLHVDDFVFAVHCWLSAEVPINGIFEVGDGESGGYDYPSMARLSQEVWGRPVRCVKIPTPLIHMLASTNLFLSKYLHYVPMLIPGKVKEFQHPDWVCDNAPLIKALPCWKPRISLRSALPQLFP